MRKIEELIYDIRVLTQNQNYSTTSGVPDEVFIGFINDGQKRLQSLVSNSKSTAKLFTREDIISIVAGQEGYSLPKRLAYGKEVENVEFSYDGTTSNFTPMEKRSFFNRNTVSSDYPSFYYRRALQIFINPVPSVSQGAIRVIYEAQLDDLDKRRGKISTVTGLTSTGFTSITIDSSADETSNPVNLTNADYICIVDKDGTVKTYNIPFGTYDTVTNIWTPLAGFTFQAGETIAVGNYVVFGKWKTNYSGLMDDMEHYLVQYGTMRTYHVDSSTKYEEQKQVVSDIEIQIVSQAASQTAELQRIPQLDYGEWW